MGKYLALALDGDIRQRDVFKLSKADLGVENRSQGDADKPYGHAFKVIGTYQAVGLGRKGGKERKREGRKTNG